MTEEPAAAQLMRGHSTTVIERIQQSIERYEQNGDVLLVDNQSETVAVVTLDKKDPYMQMRLETEKKRRHQATLMLSMLLTRRDNEQTESSPISTEQFSTLSVIEGVMWLRWAVLLLEEARNSAPFASSGVELEELIAGSLPLGRVRQAWYKRGTIDLATPEIGCLSDFEVGVLVQLLLLAETAWRSDSDAGLALLDLSGQFQEDEPDDAEERQEKDIRMLTFRGAGKAALLALAAALNKKLNIEAVILDGRKVSLLELKVWQRRPLVQLCGRGYSWADAVISAAILRRSTMLAELNLSNNPIGYGSQKGLIELAKALPLLPCIRTLRLCHTHTADAVYFFSAFAEQHPSLRHLFLDGNPINAAHALHLGQHCLPTTGPTVGGKRRNTLQVLSLRGCHIGRLATEQWKLNTDTGRCFYYNTMTKKGQLQHPETASLLGLAECLRQCADSWVQLKNRPPQVDDDVQPEPRWRTLALNAIRDDDAPALLRVIGGTNEGGSRRAEEQVYVDGQECMTARLANGWSKEATKSSALTMASLKGRGLGGDVGDTLLDLIHKNQRKACLAALSKGNALTRAASNDVPPSPPPSMLHLDLRGNIMPIEGATALASAIVPAMADVEAAANTDCIASGSGASGCPGLWLDNVNDIPLRALISSSGTGNLVTAWKEQDPPLEGSHCLGSAWQAEVEGKGKVGEGARGFDAEQLKLSLSSSSSRGSSSSGGEEQCEEHCTQGSFGALVLAKCVQQWGQQNEKVIGGSVSRWRTLALNAIRDDDAPALLRVIGGTNEGGSRRAEEQVYVDGQECMTARLANGWSKEATKSSALTMASLKGRGLGGDVGDTLLDLIHKNQRKACLAALSRTSSPSPRGSSTHLCALCSLRRKSVHLDLSHTALCGAGRSMHLHKHSLDPDYSPAGLLALLRAVAACNAAAFGIDNRAYQYLGAGERAGAGTGAGTEVGVGAAAGVGVGAGAEAEASCLNPATNSTSTNVFNVWRVTHLDLRGAPVSGIVNGLGAFATFTIDVLSEMAPLLCSLDLRSTSIGVRGAELLCTALQTRIRVDEGRSMVAGGSGWRLHTLCGVPLAWGDMLAATTAKATATMEASATEADTSICSWRSTLQSTKPHGHGYGIVHADFAGQAGKQLQSGGGVMLAFCMKRWRGLEGGTQTQSQSQRRQQSSTNAACTAKAAQEIKGDGEVDAMETESEGVQNDQEVGHTGSGSGSDSGSDSGGVGQPLWSLDLEGNEIGVGVAPLLDALTASLYTPRSMTIPVCGRLVALNLSRNGLGLQAAGLIADALTQRCVVPAAAGAEGAEAEGGRGARGVTAAYGLPSLTSLDLSHNSLGLRLMVGHQDWAEGGQNSSGAGAAGSETKGKGKGDVECDSDDDGDSEDDQLTRLIHVLLPPPHANARHSHSHRHALPSLAWLDMSDCALHHVSRAGAAMLECLRGLQKERSAEVGGEQAKVKAEGEGDTARTSDVSSGTEESSKKIGSVRLKYLGLHCNPFDAHLLSALEALALSFAVAGAGGGGVGGGVGEYSHPLIVGLDDVDVTASMVLAEMIKCPKLPSAPALPPSAPPHLAQEAEHERERKQVEEHQEVQQESGRSNRSAMKRIVRFSDDDKGVTAITAALATTQLAGVR